MPRHSIAAIKLELTAGSAYTLFAPQWREGNAEWQAVLGRGDEVYLFPTAEEMLAFLESGAEHDFTAHPDWKSFSTHLADSCAIAPRNSFDVVGLPDALAGEPNFDNVDKVQRTFDMARSLAEICDLSKTRRMFSVNSTLNTVQEGVEAFQGAGAGQWSAIGRIVLANWDEVVDELDTLNGHAPAVDATAVASAATAITTAQERQEKLREEAAKKREEEAKKAEEKKAAGDPYDSTVWARAGIDPIKISISGRTLYTLRCYLGDRAVFLGKNGEINTFSQPRQLARWVLEHDDHDLAPLSTWNDIIVAANAGELEVTVHPDNVYTFTGLATDIAEGPGSVDRAQLARAYELIADAADWADDDAVNSTLAANQQLQWLLNYLLDKSSPDEPVPPFDEEASGWRSLESGLTDRFTTSI